MALHQVLEAGQVALFDEIHQGVVLAVGLQQAILLADGHGGEAGDELVLALNDAQDAVLAADIGQLAVEGAGYGGQRIVVLGLDQLVHLAQLGAQGFQILGGGLLNDGGKGQQFEGVADGVDLLHIGNGEGAHDHAAAQDVLHQAVALQLAQRFAQGGAADVQTIGVIGLDDALAGRNFTGDDGVLEHLVCDFADRAALHHGLKGNGIHQGLLLWCIKSAICREWQCQCAFCLHIGYNNNTKNNCCQAGIPFLMNIVVICRDIPF